MSDFNFIKKLHWINLGPVRQNSHQFLEGSIRISEIMYFIFMQRTILSIDDYKIKVPINSISYGIKHSVKFLMEK